jgi:cell division septal protein FtsQ
VEAAARAKRARDHLARKRRQDLHRLERDRARAPGTGDGARVLGALSPVFFVLALMLGILLGPLLGEFVLLRGTPLERVAVQGAKVLSPETIARETGVIAGASLDTIDPDSVRDALLEQPWIESARTLRLPTGTLVVSVVERRAVARWHADASDAVELIDRRGTRFAGDLNVGGPLPLVSGALPAQDEVPDEVMEILEQIRRYASLAQAADRLTILLPDRTTGPDGHVPDRLSGYAIQIGEEGPRALLGDRLLAQRVARLAALLDSEEATSRSARWIDLRYADRAVLQTKPASG